MMIIIVVTDDNVEFNADVVDLMFYPGSSKETKETSKRVGT